MIASPDPALATCTTRREYYSSGLLEIDLLIPIVQVGRAKAKIKHRSDDDMR